MTTFTNRRHFAAVLRRAIAEGRLESYAKHAYGYSRMATLTDGTHLLYRHPSALVDPCEREKDDDDGREYGHPREALEDRYAD